MDSRVVDVNVLARTNIKSISVVTTLAITILVIDIDLVQGKVISTVDAEDLHGRVLNVDIIDVRADHLVSIEELRLRLATVGTLSIPPTSTITINNMAGSTFDSDIGSGDRDERTLPLLVAEGSLTLEDDLGSLLQTCQIESLAGGDLDVGESNGRAGSLGLHGGLGAFGTGEGTARAGFQVSWCSLDRGGTEQADEAQFEVGDHGKWMYSLLISKWNE